MYLLKSAINYQEFWKKFFELRSVTHPRYQSRSWGNRNWFKEGAGITGAAYAASFDRSGAIVQFEIKLATKSAKENILRSLIFYLEERKSVIDEAFGQTLWIEKNYNSFSIRKGFHSIGDIRNPNTWDDTILELIDTWDRLRTAVDPHLIAFIREPLKKSEQDPLAFVHREAELLNSQQQQ